MADTRKTAEAERKVYRYLGPADQLGVARTALEPDGTQLYDYFRPGQDLALDETQLRWLEQRGHHFEGRGTAVAGTPIPGIPDAFVQATASPPPIAQAVRAVPVQQATQPAPAGPSEPVVARATSEGFAAPEVPEEPRRGRRND